MQLGEKFREQVLAAEVSDGALFDLAVLPVGLDDADVLVDGTVGGGDADGAQVHGESITTKKQDGKVSNRKKWNHLAMLCHYAFRVGVGPAVCKCRKPRGAVKSILCG